MKYLLEGHESQRLRFRLLEENDFSTWMEFCSHPTATQFIFMVDPQPPEVQCRQWFDRIFYRYEHNLGGMNVLIDKFTNQFVGQCALQIQEVDGVDEMEIGYSLLPSQWGKGYAIEAAQKCRDEAFKNNYCDRLISIIDHDNTSSINVALKNGMTLEKESLFQGLPVQIYSINIEKWNLISTEV